MSLEGVMRNKVSLRWPMREERRWVVHVGMCFRWRAIASTKIQTTSLMTSC